MKVLIGAVLLSALAGCSADTSSDCLDSDMRCSAGLACREVLGAFRCVRPIDGIAGDAGNNGADASSSDAMASDSGAAMDAGSGPTDSGLHADATPVDSGVRPDATPVDSGVRPDATSVDSGIHPDAAPVDTGVPPSVNGEYTLTANPDTAMCSTLPATYAPSTGPLIATATRIQLTLPDPQRGGASITFAGTRRGNSFDLAAVWRDTQGAEHDIDIDAVFTSPMSFEGTQTEAVSLPGMSAPLCTVVWNITGVR